ncbi:MAG TPA: hypothetical protein VMY88_03635 [Acidimicrobiales bacterium]|nr:hypothetical protein [Acidimicrobiales bacterium]
MSRASALVVGALVALAGAGLLVFGALRLASDPEVARAVADETFTVGEAERLARTIAAGGPLLFQDPLEQGGDGRGRDIYVEHKGNDPTNGWSAVEVATPGTKCRLELDRRTGRYVRPCPDNTRYPAVVEGGVVVVDLREQT